MIKMKLKDMRFSLTNFPGTAYITDKGVEKIVQAFIEAGWKLDDEKKESWT